MANSQQPSIVSLALSLLSKHGGQTRDKVKRALIAQVGHELRDLQKTGALPDWAKGFPLDDDNIDDFIFNKLPDLIEDQEFVDFVSGVTGIDFGQVGVIDVTSGSPKGGPSPLLRRLRGL